MHCQDIIKIKKDIIDNESSDVTRLFRFIDLYEYLLKIQVSYLIHRLTEAKADPNIRNTHSIENIFDTIKNNFEKPSLGHWISILRESQKLNLLEASEANIILKEIVADAEKIVEIRNNIAHGITPDNDTAIQKNRSINIMVERFINFYQRYNFYEKIEDICESTPLMGTIEEIYNGIKKKGKCEYLNFASGIRNAISPQPDINDYFAKYFKTNIETSDFELSSLLKDYFERPYWESKIDDKMEQFENLFIYGDAGVGKTTMMAYTAKKYSLDMFMYSSARGSELSAKSSMARLYNSYRTKIGKLAPLPEVYDNKILEDYINDLVKKHCNSSKKNNFRFIFDGIDELSNEEFNKLKIFLRIFKNSDIKFIFSTRNSEVGLSIQEELGQGGQIKIAPLTEGEIRIWLKSYNEKLPYPSDILIKKITQVSEGNFLYLKSLPISKSEEEYFSYLKVTPSSIQKVFENMLCAYENINIKSIEVIALISIIPNGCSKAFIKDFFHFNRIELGEILSCINPIIKEVQENVFILFHARFVEFVAKALKDEISEIRVRLISEIERFEKYINPLSDIPDIFVAENECKKLPEWIVLHYRDSGHDTSKISYIESIRGVVKSFLILSQSNLVTFKSNLCLLEEFIVINFQALYDWRFSLTILECVEKNRDYYGLEKHPIIMLFLGVAKYTLMKFDESLIYLNESKKKLEVGSLSYFRCVDVIGLNCGKLNRDKEALEAYTEVIDYMNDKDVFRGHALLNRGYIYLRNKNTDMAIKDLIDGTIIMENTAYDDKWFKYNLHSVNGKLPAELNVSMGYERIIVALKAKCSEVQDNNEYILKVNKYVKNLVDLMDNLLNTYNEEVKGFTFTSRTLLTLAEHFIEINDDVSVRKYAEIINESYIPTIQQDRFGKVMQFISKYDKEVY